MNRIDLTPRNEGRSRSPACYERPFLNLVTGDAEHLPFPDESFDFVYSFGVVHHSPDTEGIVREIRRVLRPGGRCSVPSVYHKWSIFFLWSVLLTDWIAFGGFTRRSLKERISRIRLPE